MRALLALALVASPVAAQQTPLPRLESKDGRHALIVDGKPFPRIRTADGSAYDALSPHGTETLAADRWAFVALMTHLAKNDAQNTVIMLQVEAGEIIRAEEGGFVAGAWVTARLWNGDQTDYGFNFTGEPVMLRVTMGSNR